MTNTFNIQKYYAELPRKRFASAAMIFDDDRLLIVKTSYKDGWVLPGGGVDADEGPYTACAREVAEEVGLVVTSATLGGVAFLNTHPVRHDAVELFWICNVASHAGVQIDGHEIVGAMWATYDECKQMMRAGLGFRTLAVWDAHRVGRTVYIENDQVF